MERRWHRLLNVVLALALVAMLALTSLLEATPVAASPAGLTFHSGFEIGDFTEWNSVIGVNGQCSVQSTITETGDYAMRCNTSSGYAFTVESGSPYRLTVYLYIATAPNTDCAILGADTEIFVGLSSDRYLKLYDWSIKDTGTTQLNTSTWYRISLSLDAANDTAKVYLDGVEECSSTTISGDVLENWLGSQTACTADLYFDNYASDDIESADDIGDIRVLRSQPNAMGTYTGKWQRFPASTNHYEKIDECPADDADYTWADADGTQLDESYGLENCSTLGLGANDTVKAVSIWWRYETGGGGDGEYASMVRDDGTDYYDWTINDIKNPTWLNRYDVTMPNGGAAWTQARFNAFEVGMATDDANKDMWLYCVMVMVAVEPAAILGQIWYLSSIGGSKVMYKGDDTKTAGTVTVADDQFQIWRANEEAVNVGFPANTWTGVITLDDASTSNETFAVEVGRYVDTTFTSYGSQTFSEYGDDKTHSFSISAGGFTVPETKYLALRITNPAGSDNLVVKTGLNYSYLTSGASDPGYPVPELPTIILLGAGLACLGGYIIFMRRKRRSVSL